ncbi:NAD(P)-dependent oxidoreductase [Methylophilaceae bacterium]|nr:NAD(P)-dependent oxidoreductase [Methylophilaceae bacterium]
MRELTEHELIGLTRQDCDLTKPDQIKQVTDNHQPDLTESNTGIYHLVPNGSSSWYEFAKQIIGQTNPQFNLEDLYPIQTREFPTKTKRPKNSILNNAKIKKVLI